MRYLRAICQILLVLAVVLPAPAAAALPRQASDVVTPQEDSLQSSPEACTTCHSPAGSALGWEVEGAAPHSSIATHSNELTGGGQEEPFTLDCIDCHDAHGSSTNLYAIRQEIRGYTVVFTQTTGIDSFDEGGADPSDTDDLCVTCHINPTDNAGYPTSNHPGGDHGGGADYRDGDCTTCHPHSTGFLHGGGSGGGCVECHGHDAGTLFDPDASLPYTPGTLASQGRGTYQSHSLHTEFDADDLAGPAIYCDTCHDITSFPYFNSGTDANGDGKYDLGETDVCDVCHSPGGTYDGVDDAAIGAKQNWREGVYAGADLIAGKEKWCAGCHDESPSLIQGVSAPNVIGDEDAATDYGLGYGYFKTGHGLPAGEVYAWTEKAGSAQERQGAGLGCDACHDFSGAHVDGLARTYAQPGTPESYQSGYRLKSVGGQVPLEVPRSNLCPWDPGYSSQLPVEADDFALCFSCHDPEPFITQGSTSTNFRNDPTAVNAHYDHLAPYQDCGPGPLWASDWDSTLDSRATCVVCHSVHGTDQLAMVNEGRLVAREPGLEVAYYNPTVSYQCGGPNPHPPTPPDVTLPDSTGTVWNANVGNLCSGCHGSCGFDALYLRVPFDKVAPYILHVYGRVGSDILTVHFSEPVYSDLGASGDLVPADFALVDADDGRTIVGVSHTAGEAIALLTLSAPLDAVDDVGTDTLSAATAASIYDAIGNPMDTTPVTVLADDSTPPTSSDLSPAPGATDVPVDSSLSLTLADGESGIDWTTFSIQLVGDKGYSQVYTDADTGAVSKVGTPDSYDVTVDPGTNFGDLEQITVTVQVDDLSGNSLVPPTWSFTTATGSTPQVVVLHPSDVVTDGGFATLGGLWSDVLDSNDGDTSYVHLCCSAPGGTFYTDMDDPGGLSGATIQSLTVHVYARYVDGPWPGSVPVTGNLNVGYKTGTSTVWQGSTAVDDSGSYNLVSSATYTTDSDGGDLDLSDINNLQIAVQRNNAGASQLRVTEVYVEVVYTASGLRAQTQARHPVALTEAQGCEPLGGTWSSILDRDDGDASYAACTSYYDLESGALTPARFGVGMDLPSGLAEATIDSLAVGAVVRLVEGSGSSGRFDLCYDTGGAQVCDEGLALDRGQGYSLVMLPPRTTDPDGGPLDLSDLVDVHVELIWRAAQDQDTAVTLYVTEVLLEIGYTRRLRQFVYLPVITKGLGGTP